MTFVVSRCTNCKRTFLASVQPSHVPRIVFYPGKISYLDNRRHIFSFFGEVKVNHVWVDSAKVATHLEISGQIITFRLSSAVEPRTDPGIWTEGDIAKIALRGTESSIVPLRARAERQPPEQRENLQERVSKLTRSYRPR